MEQPQGSNEKPDGPDEPSAEPRVAVVLSSKRGDEEQAETRQHYTEESEDEVEQALKGLKIFWSFIKKTFREAKPGERLNAWLTGILIVCSLGVALIYWLQLRQMTSATSQAKRQLEDAEEISRARIVVKEHVMQFSTWELNPKLTYTIAKITIKNAGGTVATDINVDGGTCGFGIAIPNGIMEITPNSKPGDDLAPQDMRTYTFDCGASFGNPLDPHFTDYSSHFAVISYKDIYGREYAIPDCIVWYPSHSRGFHSCAYTYHYKK